MIRSIRPNKKSKLRRPRTRQGRKRKKVYTKENKTDLKIETIAPSQLGIMLFRS